MSKKDIRIYKNISGSNVQFYPETKASLVLVGDEAYLDELLSTISSDINLLKANTDTTMVTRVTALEGTVGDSSSGLVKSVADDKAAITALQDLLNDKTVNGNIVKGLISRVASLESELSVIKSNYIKLL